MIALAANRTALSNRHQTQLATHRATSSGPLGAKGQLHAGLLGSACALPGTSRQHPLPQHTIQDQHQRPLHPLHSCRGRIRHEFLARRPPCEACPFRGADRRVRQAALWGHVASSALWASWSLANGGLAGHLGLKACWEESSLARAWCWEPFLPFP